MAIYKTVIKAILIETVINITLLEVFLAKCMTDGYVITAYRKLHTFAVIEFVRLVLNFIVKS